MWFAKIATLGDLCDPHNPVGLDALNPLSCITFVEGNFHDFSSHSYIALCITTITHPFNILNALTLRFTLQVFGVLTVLYLLVMCLYQWRTETPRNETFVPLFVRNYSHLSIRYKFIHYSANPA